MNLVRGRIYLVDLDLDDGPKPMLVVSNNIRNAQLPEVLAVRITTSPKPPMASIIDLPTGEPQVGRVLCDRITVIYKDEVIKELGAVSPPTMQAVESGLKHALGMA
ncbi:MAG: mRNA interferase MazF [Actinomycetota bacterium]|nr:mRNA interferase MazF [Actinomycetota bacterium]